MFGLLDDTPETALAQMRRIRGCIRLFVHQVMRGATCMGMLDELLGQKRGTNRLPTYSSHLLSSCSMSTCGLWAQLSELT